ncbi:MAG TPA: hypothetical protein VFT04_06345 [Gemmatimonadales bacterium]|nr:hypothetical protein [Gemmatimonadales bacterium]
MTSVAETRRDYDYTALSHVLRRAIVLGIVTAVVVVALAFVTRLMDGMLETVVGAVVLLFGLTAVTVLPGLWTRARTIEGIAGAAGIGLAATVVFLLVDVALLQPLGVYTNRWREIGGNSNWWYHPVWWMAGTFLPWMGALIVANRARRGRSDSVGGVMGVALAATLVLGALAVVVGFPGAGWNLSTFGVAFLPGIAAAALLSSLGRSTA